MTSRIQHLWIVVMVTWLIRIVPFSGCWRHRLATWALRNVRLVYSSNGVDWQSAKLFQYPLPTGKCPKCGGVNRIFFDEVMTK